MIYPAPGRWTRPYRLTIDEPDDLLMMEKLFDALGPLPTIDQVIGYLDEHPEIASMNQHVEQKATIGVESKL